LLETAKVTRLQIIRAHAVHANASRAVVSAWLCPDLIDEQK
jgi:hypothetical protein